MELAYRLALPVVGVGVYSLLVILAEPALFSVDMVLPGDLHALLGFLLGLLLAYRTNTAYARWWEGRQLWGKLVNDLRSVGIKARALVDLSPEARQDLSTSLVGFAYALKDHLRGQASLQAVPGFAEEAEQPGHVPAWLASRIYAMFRRWRDDGWADGFAWIALDRSATGLMDVCGGCERIRNTPPPFSHRMSIGLCIAVYLAALPWCMPDAWWTPPVVMLAAFFFLGMEEIAHDIEEPFGTLQDDLPLDTLCQGIERSVGEILLAGGSPAPEEAVEARAAAP